jgi:hypothetical protein
MYIKGAILNSDLVKRSVRCLRISKNNHLFYVSINIFLRGILLDISVSVVFCILGIHRRWFA